MEHDARHAFNVSAAGLYRSARTGAQYESVLSSQPENLVAEDKYLAHVFFTEQGIASPPTWLSCLRECQSGQRLNCFRILSGHPPMRRIFGPRANIRALSVRPNCFD